MKLQILQRRHFVYELKTLIAFLKRGIMIHQCMLMYRFTGQLSNLIDRKSKHCCTPSPLSCAFILKFPQHTCRQLLFWGTDEIKMFGTGMVFCYKISMFYYKYPNLKIIRATYLLVTRLGKKLVYGWSQLSGMPVEMANWQSDFFIIIFC